MFVAGVFTLYVTVTAKLPRNTVSTATTELVRQIAACTTKNVIANTRLLSLT